MMRRTVKSLVHGPQMGSGQDVPIAATVEVERVSCLKAQMADSAEGGTLALLGTEAIAEDSETAQA
jgi:hypothetical protein